MTTREPDRYEEKANAVYAAKDFENDPVGNIAAALRQAADEALERAAQLVEQRCYNHGPRPVSWCQYCQMAIRIRALTPSPEAPPTKVNACQVDLRTDKDRECFEDIVQAATRILRSEPVAPAPSELRDVEHIENLIAEFGDDPKAALECISEYVGLRLHNLKRTASPAAQGKETRK